MQSIIEVYTEFTPNPDSLKFVCNRILLTQGSADFESADQCQDSPFAEKLFSLGNVARVFLSQNYVTVTKSKEVDWIEIKDNIRQEIKVWLEEEKQIVTESFSEEDGNAFSEEDSELVRNIKKSLDQYVKPAVETDGGAIQFKDFNSGKVTVLLKGACSGCPSSTVTLKAGIEGLLKRLHPEVEEVVAEEG